MAAKFFPAVRASIPLLAVLIAIGGCAVAAGTNADPPSLSTLSIQGIPIDAWLSLTSISFGGEMSSVRAAAYSIMSFGYLSAFDIEVMLQAALATWNANQPSTYTVGQYYTITWTRDGNSWTWAITFDDGEVSLSYGVTFTATDSGWDVAISQDGQQWLSGSLSSDGSEGTAVFHGPNDPSADTVATAWEPDQAPYALRFTINATGSFATYGNSTTATVILRTDIVGDNWYWEYSDNATPTPGIDWDEYHYGVE